MLATSVLMLLCQQSFAQPNTIDSLKKLAAGEKEQTTLTELYLQLSIEYNDNNTDSELYYAQKAFTSATNKQPQQFSNTLTQLGTAHFNAGHYDTALSYYHQSLKVHLDKDLDTNLAMKYINVGNIYIRLAKHNKAIAYYDTALQTARGNSNNRLAAIAINNLASVYYDRGAYSEALENYLDGLKLHEEVNNKTDIEKSLLNIANVYFRLEDHNKAKEYLSKARDVAEAQNSNWGYISILTTYGMIYNEEQKYDSSLSVLLKALELSEKIKSPFLTNILKGNVAEAYFNLGEYEKAHKLYKECMVASKQLQDDEGLGIAKAGLGQIDIKRGATSKGIANLKDALNTIQQSGNIEQAKAIADTLAVTYKRLGNYKLALTYNELKDNYEDSLAKDKALQSARNLEFEYKLSKKEARIAILEKDSAIEASKLSQQRTQLIAALIGLAMAIIIAALIYRNLKTARHKNELITQQKKEIEIQAAKLQELNEFKDTTFSVLSHDLRSPINALTGTMAMLDEGIITPEEFAEHKDELNKKLQSVSLMLDNLLQWAKSQMKGEQTLDIQKISVRRKALRALAVLKDAADQKNIKLAGDIPENLYAYADRNQIEMVMRNLVSNAIKFTPDNGSVTITAEELDGNRVAVHVSDTGVGMSQEQIDKLLDGSPNSSMQGTGGEKGTGIGLHLSHTFVKNNKGELSIKSQLGKGTTFTLTLPTVSLA